MATTTKQQKILKAFRIDSREINAIWKLISEAEAAKPNVRFYCSDGSNITDDGTATLLNFPNTKSRRITRIVFDNGHGSTPQTNIEINDGGKLGPPAFEYTVVGEDKDVIYICDRIN